MIEPLLADYADMMRGHIEAARQASSLPGYATVPIERLEQWAEAMEAASLQIEGPA
jgi:hypothetical protein